MSQADREEVTKDLIIKIQAEIIRNDSKKFKEIRQRCDGHIKWCDGSGYRINQTVRDCRALSEEALNFLEVKASLVEDKKKGKIDKDQSLLFFPE